ncbi:4Fe-4S binding protein [Mangrovicoccus sp. HB161399]|uniref:4Fe-4S binding protein n=1 Tax=Mangrovicoccus sp. HB161399 TaxID=2720392 RepID=UPI001556ED61|nr:4Fe-4S binding protein [Mangrovicoccus sp. HB161399]
MIRGATIALLICLACLLAGPARAFEPLSPEQLAARIMPPYSLGEPVGGKGVHELLNSGGALAGYVFETEPLAPLPGFSGVPIDILVMIDLEGRFLDVSLLHHNEPIFVSGLGEAPFHAFFEQYRGLSIATPMVVGSPYGKADGPLTYLDGVTKATASIRIAHESLLAATRAVAQEKMKGIAAEPPAHPDMAHDEDLDWEDMIAEGIAGRLAVTNAAIDRQFAGTIWAHDDPEAAAEPEGMFLDLYVVDLGPPAIARAVLGEDTARELANFRTISPDDEPILVIDAGRHGLVSEDFVRNTAPDRLTAEQDGLPVALRDADLFVTLNDGLPAELSDATAMILRTDRRLGFDPARPWILTVEAVREHGMFQPATGSVNLVLEHATPARFFARPEAPRSLPPWRAAAENRQGDLIALGLGLALLLPVLGFGQSRLAAHPRFGAIRLGVIAAMLGFVGWWGQGQLSIVTPLAVLAAALQGGSLAFLAYDPFSLLIWAAAIAGLFLWGRGLFCGWLCPFGALQEFADRLGRLLHLPQVEPSPAWDRRLKALKYVVLAFLLGTAVLAPGQIDKAAEVEPFKTAITTFFLRDWQYAAYAAFWLLLAMVTFKGFCRYVCPLGALMAVGGMLRLRRWIPRREDCGSPCQLCKVRCRYGAIERSGKIAYDECFQCLDCVAIHDDPRQCVPLVLAAKRRDRGLEAAE